MPSGETSGSREWESPMGGRISFLPMAENEGKVGQAEDRETSTTSTPLPLLASFTPLRTSSLKYISFYSCIMVPQNPGNPI